VAVGREAAAAAGLMFVGMKRLALAVGQVRSGQARTPRSQIRRFEAASPTEHHSSNKYLSAGACLSGDIGRFSLSGKVAARQARRQLSALGAQASNPLQMRMD